MKQLIDSVVKQLIDSVLGTSAAMCVRRRGRPRYFISPSVSLAICEYKFQVPGQHHALHAMKFNQLIMRKSLSLAKTAK